MDYLPGREMSGNFAILWHKSARLGVNSSTQIELENNAITKVIINVRGSSSVGRMGLIKCRKHYKRMEKGDRDNLN